MILNLEEEIQKEKRKKRAEYMKKWRANNPEKTKKIQQKAMKKYHCKNRKKTNEIQSAYYYRHREEILKRMKEKRDREKENNNVSIP